MRTSIETDPCKRGLLTNVGDRFWGILTPTRRTKKNGQPIGLVVPVPLQEQLPPSEVINQQITEGMFNPRESIERWKNLPARIVLYEGGVHPDGTVYSSGTRLLIGEKCHEEQVMDSFEEPWCEASAKALLEGKTGPQIIIEGGFGLGIISEYLFQEMLNRGGEYHIIELNETIFKRLEKWAAEKQRLVDRMRLKSTLKIIPHFGDAYDVLESRQPDGSSLFKPGSIDGIVMDLHQLREDDRGIENLKKVNLIKDLLEPDGGFVICGFHKYNQTGDLDPRQRARISPHFHYSVDPILVVPPKDCEYLQWPNNILPVVICKKPRLRIRVKTAA